jgi:hypothetical protein
MMRFFLILPFLAISMAACKELKTTAIMADEIMPVPSNPVKVVEIDEEANLSLGGERRRVKNNTTVEFLFELGNQASRLDLSCFGASIEVRPCE